MKILINKCDCLEHNECLCVVLEQNLDEIPSDTMGNCESKILNEF